MEELTTPSAQWRADGEADPHGDRYDCERAALAMGHLTDDELANGAFLNYDHFDVARLMRGDPDYHPPIAWMTAVKDRIRWLSRSLEAARASLSSGVAASPPQPQSKDLPPLPANIVGLKHMTWPLTSLYTADQMRDYALAALATSPTEGGVRVPHSDRKLVPFEPTPEMLEAAREQWHRIGTPKDAWQAMWHAAPSLSTEAPQGGSNHG